MTKLIQLLILFWSPTSLLAGDQVGTVTQIEGNVKIFSHPSPTLQKEQGSPRALFEGEYYLVHDAKPGDLIEKGNILRTAPGAKARIVYENGDQFNVGSATAYRVTWDKDTAKGQMKINLAYGKIRGIIEKGGPRSRLQIRTKTAVMGVRGTDFFIAEGAKTGGTEIVIIRGSVEVKPQVQGTDQGAMTDPVKPVQILAGYSAEIGLRIHEKAAVSTSAQAPLADPVIELRKTSKEEYAGIQKASTLPPNPSLTDEGGASRTPAEVSKNLEALEKKASTTVLKDLQSENKELYASLEKKLGSGITAQDMNQAAIENLKKDAPKALPQRKPHLSEMEDVEDGAYDKYFKEINP